MAQLGGLPFVIVESVVAPAGAPLKPRRPTIEVPVEPDDEGRRVG
jgi:hypothetical protein